MAGDRAPGACAVLFVCWGNICRSPTAEGIMRSVLAESGLQGAVVVDSAGTSGEHAGDRPDLRAQREAARRGIDLSDLRARKVVRDDFSRFDLLLPVDLVNERRLLGAAPDAAARSRVRPLCEFGSDQTAYPEVPDPYYGGPDGFALVFDLLEDTCRGLLGHLVDSGRVRA
jgi:protein-tyrosine phosphatase